MASLASRLGRALTAARTELVKPAAAAVHPNAASPAADPGPRTVRSRIAPAPRFARSMFKGGSYGRLTADWAPGTIAPDDEIRGQMRFLRARARQLSRDNPLVGQFLALLTSNVLGSGGRPTLQADVRDARGEPVEEVNDAIERAWDDWRSGPVTADRKWNLATFEQLALESLATDGEIYSRAVMSPDFRHGLALQSIDCDLVDETIDMMAGRYQNEIRMGVEVDRWGAPLRYWVKEDPRYQAGSRYRDHFTVEASEMLHVYRARRANQTRGVTWFTRVMYELNMLAGYHDGALTLLRTAANKQGFLEWKDTSLMGGGGADDPAGDVSTSDAASGSTSSAAAASSDLSAPGGPYFEADPGSIHELAPGQTFSSWDPSSPTGSQNELMKDVIRLIASGLGVAYHSLGNDLADVNFSTAREWKLIERELWRMVQDLWIASFRQPLYERWLQAAILTGALQLPSADWRLYRRAVWIPRGFDWVDPKSEADANATLLSLGLTSRKRILAERGLELDVVFKELAAEEAQAEELGIDVDGIRPSQPAGGGGAGAGDDAEDEDETDDEAAPAKPKKRGRSHGGRLNGVLRG